MSRQELIGKRVVMPLSMAQMEEARAVAMYVYSLGVIDGAGATRRVFGRKHPVTANDLHAVWIMLRRGAKTSDIAKAMNISRYTVVDFVVQARAMFGQQS